MTRAMHADRRRSNSRRGVTLIEMLVVVTIIALFAALVGTNVFKQGDRARITAAKAQIEQFMTALGAFKLDTGVFPTTEMGLQVLRVRPPGIPTWNGPYMPKEVPMDPWGRPYLYRFPGEINREEPELVSLGADGQPGGEGINADIVSWK